MIKENKTIRIGTRASPLALVQANHVKSLLEKAGHDAIEIVRFTTSGDKIQDKKLTEFGGKGLFTKEIEQGLLEDTIDIAVHSMKDVATILPDGLAIPCVLQREDPRDVWVSNKAESFLDLPEGATVGTASLRRGAQVLAHRPDLKIVTFRGNVGTRIEKLNRGDADGTLLALAGLNRLGKRDVATSIIEPQVMLPAPAQGAIGLQCRTDDVRIHQVLAPLNHQMTKDLIGLERLFLRYMDGSCRTPIAALAQQDDSDYTLQVFASTSDGKSVYQNTCSGSLQYLEEQIPLMAAEAKPVMGAFA
ncbi:MAG: hydroxymethylbilane synthase [Alphaproteobacteria bacterium]